METTLTEEQINAFIRRPQILLMMANDDRYGEEFWFQVYHYLESKRMDYQMYKDWKDAQELNGFFKFAALGQLFARYATLRKGFKPLEKSSFQKSENV